jgi:hypothetical protein
MESCYKCKAVVPQHAYGSARGRGGIAPTHSLSWHYMGVSDSASLPGRAFTLGVSTPGTHWTGGWVDPRAGPDTEIRGKILLLLLRIEH